jgi:glutathionylspermidine synthase
MMERQILTPRPNWQQRCKDVGFDYYDLPSSDGSMYWSDAKAYRFTAEEVDRIDDATLELHQMCMDWVDDVVRGGRYAPQFGFTDADIELIETSWRSREPSLFGRFDLGYDGQRIKMFEYNADTPTSLLEASVVQWDWLVDRGLPDQFNSLHEKLIEQWKVIQASLPIMAKSHIHFVGMTEAGREDWGNIEYLMDTAFQAGLNVSELQVENIGWDAINSQFVDLNLQPISTCFKLYPWEWLIKDEYAQHLSRARTRWIEPAWNMLLSSKALLPLLWQKYPNHPLLLEAHFASDELPKTKTWVKKPILSREGANVSKIEFGVEHALSGSELVDEYAQSGYIVQEWFELPNFDGFRPMIGSWIIGNQTAGMGIREDYNVVTGNDSHFVPHYFE